MKKLSLVALLVTLSACKSDKIEGEAISATVVLDPGVHASCVLFEVRDPAGQVPTARTWVARDKNELKIAVFQGPFPSDVVLAARPYQDGACEKPTEPARTPNGDFVTQTASFVTNTVTKPEPLRLLPGRDTDNDQYVDASSGGADCQDATSSVNPGIEEACTLQEDRNCDGKRGCEDTAKCGANACIAPPTNLVLTLPTAPVTAGTCTSGKVQLKDSSGADTRVETASPVSLAGVPSSGIAFFKDAACTQAATSATIPASEGAATFYFKGLAVTTVAVSATYSTLPTATQNVQIIPGVGNRLVFLGSPLTVQAGRCSPSQVQFQSQDSQGLPSSVTSATTVSLEANVANFQFFTTTDCSGSAVTSVNLPAGTNTAGFYFKGKTAGDVQVTVAAPGFTGGSVIEKITAGPPAVVVLTGPTGATAGSCSSSAVTATLNDDQGNLATVTSTPLNLALTVSTGKPLTFSTTSGTCSPTVTSVTINPGASTASFFFQGTQAGASTIRAASGSISGTLNVTINAGPPTVLEFTTPPVAVKAGDCSTVRTVQLRDSQNNPVLVGQATSVALSVSPLDAVQFFTTANCTGSPVTATSIPVGSSDASFYFKAIHTPAARLTAAVNTLTKDQNETLTPGNPTQLLLSPSPLPMLAGQCKQVSLQVQDSNMNASPVSGLQTVGLLASPASGFTFHTGSDCSGSISSVNVSSGSANATFYVKGTAPGDVAVTATLAPLTNGALTAKVSPAAPSKIVFKTGPLHAEKGKCSGINRLEVQDTFNNPSPVTPDKVINLTGSTGTLTFYKDPACTTTAVTSVTVPDSQSETTFYFKDDTTLGNVTITASDGVLPNVTQTETIDPLQPTALAFTTTPQTLPAGQCSTVVTVETRALGSATPVTANLQVDLASLTPGFTFFAGPGCTNPTAQVTVLQNQSSVSFFYQGTKAGTASITATAGALSDNQSATINALAASKVAFSTQSHTVTAGVCSPLVTINSVDTFGNVVAVSGDQVVNLTDSGSPSDPAFRFYSDPSCGSSINNATFPSTQNSVSFYFKGNKARTVTLHAGGGASGFTEGTQNHTIQPANLTTLAFSPSTPASPGLLAGTCERRTIERQDDFQNPVSDPSALTVNLSGSEASEFFPSAGCSGAPVNSVTIPAGSGSVDFYFKGYHGGDNATADLMLMASSTLPGTASQTEKIVPTVRAGTCAIAANTNSIPCSIAPALAAVNKAFLIFQAISSSTDSVDANVRCRVSSTSQVLCERNGTNNTTASIRWSVAEFPTGMTVQSQDVPCAGTTTNATLSSANRAQSFLLLSSARGDNNENTDKLRLAELTAVDQAQIRKSGNCNAGDTNHLQAVTYSGASVQRGVAVMGTSYTATASLTGTVDLSRSILLYSYSASGGGAKSCDRAVRGELTNATTVSFSRSEGDSATCNSTNPIPEISWEVVEFPQGTRVQQFKQQLSGTSALISLGSPVDPSRTILIVGGQWASGQVHGEGKTTADAISDVRAQASLLDASTVTLTRTSSNSTATFTVFVVELKP